VGSGPAPAYSSRVGFVNPFRALGRPPEEEEQRARVALIADDGDVRSLVELLPFLPPEAHRLGPEAARAAASVLGRCSPLQLAWFDQWYRGGWLPKGSPAPTWKDVRLGTLSWARQFRGVVALASFHGNGFVRELAVRLLSDFDDGFELPYLLIRTNDWVPKVRIAAATAALQRVGPSYTEHWLRCLGLLDRLRMAGRRERDCALYVHRVEALLLHADARTHLESALSTGDLAVRRAALRLAFLLPGGERRRLLTIATRDADPLVASEAAKDLLANAPTDGSSSVVAELLHHRFGRIRGRALAAALEQQVPSASDWLERAIFDNARCVREVGRHELSKLENGHRDFAAMYRKRMSESLGRDRTVALEGLAEVGTRDDVDLLLRFLHDPNARVRAAAIAGIGRCAGEAHHDALEAALRDRSSMVRRAVTPFANLCLGRAVVRRARRELRERSAQAPDPLTRR
jgi:HEAT repeat protein